MSVDEVVNKLVPYARYDFLIGKNPLVRKGVFLGVTKKEDAVYKILTRAVSREYGSKHGAPRIYSFKDFEINDGCLHLKSFKPLYDFSDVLSAYCETVLKKRNL